MIRSILFKAGNWRRSVKVLVILLSITGCVIEKRSDGIHIYQKSNKFITPNGYTLAKPLKFKLKGKLQSLDTTMLSTSQLYVDICEPTHWFKFYADGKVVLSNYSKPPVWQTDEFRGWGGYYNVTGNSINIEISYTQTQDQWGDLFIDGNISGDTLKFYKDRYSKSGDNIHHFTSSRNDPHPECKYYVKSKVPYLLRDPDW